MSQYDDAYMQGCCLGTFEAQFIKTLSNTETELKKTLLIKKPVIQKVEFMNKKVNA